MTIQPDTEEPPTRSNGHANGDGATRMKMPPVAPDDTTARASAHGVDVLDAPDVHIDDVPNVHIIDVAAARQLLTTTGRPDEASTSSPKRSADYRLRGLDLEAHGLAEAPAQPKRKRHPSIRRRRQRVFVKWIIALMVVALIAVLMRVVVVQPFSVTSTSMVPTLFPGTDVLVVKPHFLTGGIDTGDVIVFHQPEGSTCVLDGESRELVSRVIGLPGQTIWSQGEDIYIDGKRLNKPEWRNAPFGDLATTEIVRTEIPRGSYFVLGDNRTDTCDSRAFGPVKSSLLVGEVVVTTLRDGHPSVRTV